MILLRPGVVVDTGIAVDGSEFYLVDQNSDDQWHIERGSALAILGHAPVTGEIVNLLDGMGVLPASPKPQKPSIMTRTAMQLVSTTLPLGNPSRMLKNYRFLWQWLFTWLGFFALVFVTVLTIISLLGQFGDFLAYYPKHTDNWMLTGFSLAIAKIIHEIGHSAAVIRFGGRVKRISITLLAMILPLPRTETAGLYKVRYRHRAVIALAGMYFEWVLALLCFWVWLASEHDTVALIAHFIVGVSLPMTVAMNLVPLMKFDGYHALSATLKQQTLYEDATGVVKASIYRLCGIVYHGDPPDPCMPRRLLLAYGIAVIIWRNLIPIGIAIAVMSFVDARIMIGMAILAIVVMQVIPAVRELITMWRQRDHGLGQKIRQLFAVFVLTALLGYIALPMDHVVTYHADVVQVTVPVHSPVSGSVIESTGKAHVIAGDQLARLDNERDLSRFDRDILSRRANDAALNSDAVHLVQSARQQANSLNDQLGYHNRITRITAPVDGLFQPENQWPAAFARSEQIGVIVTDKRQVLIYLDSNGRLSEQLTGYLVAAEGTLPITATKAGYLETEFKPAYSKAADGSILYIAPLDERLVSQPATFYATERFSYLSRIIFKLVRTD